MGEAFAAVDAMVGLAEAVDALVVGGEVGAAGAAELLLLDGALGGDVALGEALVVVGEDAGDVEAVGAGHAVLARGAGDGGEVGELVSHAVQEGQLVGAEGFGGGAGADVVLQVFHEVHAAEGGHDAGVHTQVAERP